MPFLPRTDSEYLVEGLVNLKHVALARLYFGSIFFLVPTALSIAKLCHCNVI